MMTISEISAEEDEEALIMRRLRNASDSLKRGLKGLEYKMERVRRKADQSRAIRQNIELCEGTISIAGEPSPFKAYIPQDEVIKYRKDQGGSSASTGRLIYKSCQLNNRSLSLFRIGYGEFISTFGINYVTKIA